MMECESMIADKGLIYMVKPLGDLGITLEHEVKFLRA